jgi:hypothetical protein
MDSIENWTERTGKYVVNLNLVLQSEDLLLITRWLAGKILEDEYITVGEVLYQISRMDDYDLERLINLAESFEDYGPGDHNIVLMTLMLSAAEGLPVESLDQLHQNIGFLMLFLTAMSLEAKGLAVVYYENLTFDTVHFNDRVMFEGT